MRTPSLDPRHTLVTVHRCNAAVSHALIDTTTSHALAANPVIIQSVKNRSQITNHRSDPDFIHDLIFPDSSPRSSGPLNLGNGCFVACRTFQISDSKFSLL
ncbi:hypothetical protein VTL71DRAFT_11527 [Oculimacula yallundae]|uniref:Uncharacterized protein n=1 Tax=Oculimacula yallundae TaxID=86028 RepID=A0ABR4CSY2_9HELO